MKSASSALCAIVFIFCLGIPCLARQPRCDKECVRIVRGMLTESYHGFSSGFGEKANHRLGDKVGAAILQIYKGKALYKPDNIRTYLPVIQEAFKYTELIENPEDKNPVTTAALLRRLRKRVKDHFLNLEITRTLNVVQFSGQNVAPPSGRTQPNNGMQRTRTQHAFYLLRFVRAADAQR